MSNQPQPKKHNAFELVYVKDGYYYGSYDLFPSDNDVKLIKIDAWKGFEKPEPVGPVPTGNKEITTIEQVDVKDFATAQVVEENLIAGNIKKDVSILGIVGTNEGYPEPTEKAPTITENGENINIKDYASVDVAVPEKTLDDFNDSGYSLEDGYWYQYSASEGGTLVNGDSGSAPYIDTLYISYSSGGTGSSDIDMGIYGYVSIPWQITNMPSYDSYTWYRGGDTNYYIYPDSYTLYFYYDEEFHTVASLDADQCLILKGVEYSMPIYESVTLPDEGESTTFELDGVTYQITRS